MCVALAAGTVTPSWAAEITLNVEVTNTLGVPWPDIDVWMQVESTDWYGTGTTDANGIVTFTGVDVDFDTEGFDQVIVDLEGREGDLCTRYFFYFTVEDESPPAGEFSLSVASGKPGSIIGRCDGAAMQPAPLISVDGDTIMFETNYYYYQ
jgi:hypothetical protein